MGSWVLISSFSQSPFYQVQDAVAQVEPFGIPLAMSLTDLVSGGKHQLN
ncbi:MAG: hypothetical protein IPJ71_01045 [Bdellovibrionales bacterium]|nr:hypothetical protein [Bdellovibrionales bacterium]